MWMGVPSNSARHRLRAASILFAKEKIQVFTHIEMGSIIVQKKVKIIQFCVKIYKKQMCREEKCKKNYVKL